MKYLFIAMAMIVILTLFNKKETPMPTLPKNATILAIGDSLTYGHGAQHPQSYPAYLEQSTGYTVINAGINGETSSDGLKRLPKLLENKQIKLMLLCFGGNDILQHKSMLSLKENLKTMIDMAKEKGIIVVLISVPNLSLFGLSPLELYEEVADEKGIPLIEGVLADILSQPSLKSDQIHPNARGYKIMSEKIKNRLKKEGIVVK